MSYNQILDFIQLFNKTKNLLIDILFDQSPKKHKKDD